jgi:hypothetical protein
MMHRVFPVARAALNVRYVGTVAFSFGLFLSLCMQRGKLALLPAACDC